MRYYNGQRTLWIIIWWRYKPTMVAQTLILLFASKSYKYYIIRKDRARALNYIVFYDNNKYFTAKRSVAVMMSPREYNTITRLKWIKTIPITSYDILALSNNIHIWFGVYFLIAYHTSVAAVAAAVRVGGDLTSTKTNCENIHITIIIIYIYIIVTGFIH